METGKNEALSIEGLMMLYMSLMILDHIINLLNKEKSEPIPVQGFSPFLLLLFQVIYISCLIASYAS